MVALTIGLGSPLGAQAPSGDSYFRPFGQLQEGPSRETTIPMSFQVGHAVVDFSGTWAPLLKDGKVQGYFMEGRGSFRYTSSYAPEAPVFSRNLKEWHGLEPENTPQGPTLSGYTFQKARLRFVGGTLPEWTGTEAPPMVEKLKIFSQTWDRIDGFPSSQLFALHATGPAGRPLAVLEMEGRDLNLLYQYDSVDTLSERLAVIRDGQAGGYLKGWSDLITISHQPLGYDPRKGSVPLRFVLKDLDVDLRTEDNKNAEMKVREVLVPLQEGLRAFSFRLMTDITSPTERHELKVKRITDSQGNALDFSHSRDRLVVLLPQAVPASTPIELNFEYAGDFLIRPRGDNYWQLGVRGSWYPQPEHYAEESYTFHGTVRTKGEWISFLPGDYVRRGKDGDWNIAETRTSNPICFATILGGKYFVDEETRNGITLRVASYGFKGGAAIKVIKDQTFNILNYYKAFMGAYPFRDFTIIEKNEWGYGQAPPSMTYITREAFEQISNINNMQEIAGLIGQFGGRLNFKTMDVRFVLAHEIAHQYWGTLVKMPSPEDQWVTESFAEYCAALYVREFKGEGHFKRAVAGWKADAEEAKDFGSIPVANNLRLKDGFKGFKARTGLLYSKGPMLLHALHKELGDEVFLTWLKSAQTNFKWKFAPTKRLFDLLAFVTKKDHTSFYDTYFWGTAMPPIK